MVSIAKKAESMNESTKTCCMHENTSIQRSARTIVIIYTLMTLMKEPQAKHEVSRVITGMFNAIHDNTYVVDDMVYVWTTYQTE